MRNKMWLILLRLDLYKTLFFIRNAKITLNFEKEK
ncbi:hypothetical protein EVA_01338 [gut metagenome]|uniref:Uncharacterized protein n=1 Tax=gut metagenome TaxID=749906 RepID=J9H369_9ZZZZ